MNLLNRPWSGDDDSRLVEMRIAGSSEREIAVALNRTQTAVASRRLKLQREGLCPPKGAAG